ncbi:extracellular solute-binding protein [uncultured Cohaesibacter sp.]|uniref:ABC transporter substrate-binding protein n=1 Tax=uncultured Cohaesibacter sp. TaxID=1002546 RepID=UPI002931A75F|nr:extracellular solute-binding protein [uncultured Cohaesibacter sp.]
MLRRTFLASSLVALGLSVGALTPPVIAQEKPQIWSYWTSGAEADALSALMNTAKADNKEADLVHRPISGSAAEMRQALQVAFLGGNPPAVFQSGMALELKSFVDSGRLASIDDVWAEIKGAENFAPGITKTVMVDGKVYGIPLNVHIINNVFYNKKIFAKLGLTPPKTWEEFKAVAKTLKDNGIQPLANASGPAWTLYNTFPAILSVLGDEGFYKLASGDMAFNGPEMHKAMQLFTDTYVANYMKNWSGYTWSTAADQFVKGNVAMYQMGDWLSSYLKDAGMKPGEDYDFFPAPSGKNQVVVQLDVLAFTSTGDDAAQKAGKAFLKVSGSPDGQLAFNLKKGSIAPNKTASADKYDAYGKQAFENLKTATADNEVIPNLKKLLPVQLGAEFGNQIVAYSQNPTPEALDEMLNLLEDMHKDMIDQNAFVKW